jgi:hypothetical protein
MLGRIGQDLPTVQKSRESEGLAIPRTKSGDSHVVPLTQLTLEVLARRFDEKTCDWVFPSKSATGHLVEPSKKGG